MEQVITTDLICLDVEAESKEDVIRLLAEKLLLLEGHTVEDGGSLELLP